jgi:hypothetical protein
LHRRAGGKIHHGLRRRADLLSQCFVRGTISGYVPAFRDNDIDGEVLRQLTAEDLRELSIAPNTDAELDAPFSRDVSVALGHRALHVGRATHCVDDALRIRSATRRPTAAGKTRLLSSAPKFSGNTDSLAEGTGLELAVAHGWIEL